MARDRWRQLVYPPATLEVDEVEDRVKCHLCGRWCHSLGAHAAHGHGLKAAEYRALVGLQPRRSLDRPGLAKLKAAKLRQRRKTDARVIEGIARGEALARSGQLQARAQEVHRERGHSLARVEQMRRRGQALGNGTAARKRADRERRARELGFTTLEAYYRATYVRQGARLADLEQALGVSRTAIYADLKRAGIAIQHHRDRRPWSWH